MTATRGYGALSVCGTARISTAHAATLTATGSPVVCGPCAIARWLRVLDLAVTKISTGVIAKALDDADRVTPESPHLCQTDKELADATAAAPLFPPIDQ